MNKYLFQKGSLATALGLALGLSCVSGAQALSADEIEIHGFFTAGATISDVDKRYLRTTDDEISFDEDSAFALQVFIPVDDRISLQAQLLANTSKKGDPNFELDVDWAFASYMLNDNATIRAGRIRYPLLLLSDVAEAGYAYPWIRPPVEVYSGIPFNTLDGVDVLIEGFGFGGFDLQIQPYVGSKDEDLYIQSFGIELDTELDNMMGIKLALSNDFITFNAGYTSFEESIDTELGILIEELDVGTYTFGVSVDHNNLIMMAEYVDIDYESPDTGSFGLTGYDAWYAMIGYRFGKFTPHITYAEMNADKPLELFAEGTSLPFVGDVSGAPQAFFDPSLTKLGGVSSSTLTVGLRYELSKSSALKFEWSKVEPEDNTGGLFGQTGSIFGGALPTFDQEDAQIYSIALDVVF
ncbi:MAG: porin [Porticoccaceae bacterium]